VLCEVVEQSHGFIQVTLNFVLNVHDCEYD